ncbi:ATP-binding protein [Desulfoscipio geothermicus]|uniref:histidine kinase n=1 Tax=Desulfoscipio geothermicus DSM 3669 TaxID=1121426 RepID=A0A1I6CN18_9FIRM|nr:ATP-binding protein [Desulfoscipio geothermicus]SFQ94584.1 Signal transduction histidine kinase [Desulfoscipio geothermicus DSM 3669]
MPFFRRQSLKTQLLVIVFLALLLPAAAMFYDIFFAAKTDDVLIHATDKKLTRIANLVHDQVRRELKSYPGNSQPLEEVFTAVTDPLIKHYPGVRICLYDKDSGDITILGYLHEFGTRLPEEKKERERRIYNETKAGINAVLASGNAISRLGKTYDDQFLERLVPLQINSRTIAVIWAEEMMHPIFARSSRMRLVIRYVILGVFGLGIAASLATIFGLVRRINIIKDGTVKLEQNLNYALPQMPGEMGQITSAINKMARGLIEKEQLIDQYRRSENLIAMGRTITEIAHELRAPVSVIQAAAQAMALNFQDLPRLDEYIQQIDRQVERHSKLINELLDFGRPDPGTIEKMDINELIKSVLTANEPLISKTGIKLNYPSAGHKPLVIQGNAEKLKQVFTNLIINALEAMRQNGVLTIESHAAGEQVAVSVRDTGEGIPPEDLPNIFEPFYTKKAGGNGLGLAICKRIVQIHGGSIEVKSVKGSGSEFIVSLPLYERDVMAVE